MDLLALLARVPTGDAALLGSLLTALVGAPSIWLSHRKTNEEVARTKAEVTQIVVTTLAAGNQELRNMVEDAQREAHDARLIAQDLTSRQGVLEAERDSLRHRVSELEAHIQELEAEKSLLQGRVGDLEGQIAGLTAERDGLSTRLAAVTRRIQELLGANGHVADEKEV